MEELNISEKFNVEDIRKIREYEDERRRNMNAQELMSDIYAGAEEGHKILESLKNSRRMNA